eukprot:m.43460 g.43460  ORF g.43460 m.43460 type:complete len:1411 (+) comp12040_c0_seq1:86-4318(+)
MQPMEKWSETTKAEWIRQVSEALSEQGPLGMQVKAVSLLRDLFLAYSSDVLGAEQMADFLRNKDFRQRYADFDVLASDTLMLAVVETPGALEKYKVLVKKIYSTSAIEQGILRERLEVPLLKACQLLPPDYDKALIRIRTKMFYKQEKYNLYHEENEGFSKLVTALNQDFLKSNISSKDLVARVRTLIGYFNLDPNRVLDLTLDALELHPDQAEVYLHCLREFTTGNASIANLLGLKFANYSKQGVETPSSLYASTARLVKTGLLRIEQLEPHLSPDVEDVQKRVSAYVQAVTKHVNTTALSSEKQAELDAAFQQAQKDELDARLRDQRLGLCAAFLAHADWPTAERLMDILPAYYVPSVPAARMAMLTTLHVCIEPLYRDIAAAKCARPSRTLPTSPSDIEPCTSLADFAARIMPLLGRLGPFLADDPLFMTKVVRICGHYMSLVNEVSDEQDTAMRGEVEDLFARCILPSLMLCTSNAPIAEDIWQVMSQMPYPSRFKIYGYVKNKAWRSQPELLLVRSETLKAAKGLLQRLTAENADKKMAHDLSKLCFTNPFHVFEHSLRQLEAYINLVEPFSEALKTQTQLSYDCLCFCILETLANPNKSRRKKQDIFESGWLQNLSAFVGFIYRKYAIDIEPVLQYIINRLKENQASDLIVLKELVSKIAGYEPLEDMTSMQLQALAGGQVLRQRGSTFSNARLTKEQKRSLKHMMEAFLSTKRPLLVPLLISIAQQRMQLVYGNDADTPVVLIGNLFDKCQEVFLQLLECVESNAAEGVYFKQLPSLEDLCTSYNLDVPTAMCLHRRRLTANIEDLASEQSEEGTAVSKYIKGFGQAMTNVTTFLKSLHSEPVWQEISPDLYSTFWTLSLYDLQVPSEAYSHVIAELEETNRQIRPPAGSNSRADKKKRREVTSNEATIKALQDEENRQKAVVKCAQEMLKQLAPTLVEPTHTLKSAVVTEFLRLCIYPRCFFSAADALYCAKFAQLLHEMRTPSWSTVLYFNYVFRHTACIIMSATENEASRFGRFLSETMRVLARYHADPSVYQRECAPTPGFIASFKKNAPPEVVKYADYQKMCYNWQTRLLKDFLSMLTSKDPALMRRAIVVMLKIVDHFPIITNLGKALIDTLESILKEPELRKDVEVLIVSYRRQIHERSNRWIAPSAYYPMEKRQTPKQSGVEKQAEEKPPSKKTKSSEETAENTTKPSKPVSSSKGPTEEAPHERGNGQSGSRKSGLLQAPADKGVVPAASPTAPVGGDRRASTRDDRKPPSEAPPSKRKTPSDSSSATASGHKTRSSKSSRSPAREAATSEEPSGPPPPPSRASSSEDLLPKRPKVSSKPSSSSNNNNPPPAPTSRHAAVSSPSEREGRRGNRDRKGEPRSGSAEGPSRERGSAPRDSRAGPPPPPRRRGEGRR